MVIASALETYYYSSKPYSLNGTSAHSNGASFFGGNLSQEYYKPALLFLSENLIPFHEKLCQVASTPVIVAESFFQAREHFSMARKFQIDLEDVISAALKEVLHAPGTRCEAVVKRGEGNR